MSRFAVMDPLTGDWVEVTEEGIRLGLALIDADAANRHPYTCNWCGGEWPSKMAYEDHFSSLAHKDPDHPYQEPQ